MDEILRVATDIKSIVPVLNRPTQISAGGNRTCALTDDGVVCWGCDSVGRTNVPPLNQPTQISVGAVFACALTANGVVCWGSNGDRLDVPVLNQTTQISVGQSHACAVAATGVVCWGDAEFGKAAPGSGQWLADRRWSVEVRKVGIFCEF